MPLDTLQAVLLLAGYVTAFLLGKHLHVGLTAWRARTAESTGRNREQ